MRHIIIYICLLGLLTACGADRNLRRGEKHLALGEYHEAAAEFRQGYQRIPPRDKERRGHAAIMMARCYARLGQQERAVSSYRSAARYRTLTTADRLSLAAQLMKSGRWPLAEEAYRAVLDSLPSDTLALRGLRSAQTAAAAKERGSRYTVKRMDIFGSTRADYSPMLAGDEADRLYFTSTRNDATGDDTSPITGAKCGDIYVSAKDDKGRWQKPVAVEGGVNTAYDEGSTCLSPDGREMYLTQCVTDPASPRYAEIAVSSRSDAAWGKATKLTLTRDTLSSYAHPAVSPDGEWLYFVSDMPGGLGGLDIWRCRLTAAGPGAVENLGAPVNTAGDEMFPTFRPNGDLYFSSNGHEGLGGLDIYIATRDGRGQYQIAHPGYPLNSQGDDFGMTFEGGHNRGFFSSNRGDTRGWDKIYSFECPEIVQTIKGWVYEKDGYELPAAEVRMVGTDGTNLRLTVGSDGSFTRVVKPGTQYVLMATCHGYLGHKEEVAISPAADSEETVVQFPLTSLTAPVLIDNVFYDFDRATLRPESEKSLDALVALLRENGNVTIRLAAHCDYRGSDAYNLALSERRAGSVAAYLTSHGIAADRLTPTGYGRTVPRVVTRRMAEHWQWMHEGDTLSAACIDTLSAERQEVCNQLNRRTEFIVLTTTYGVRSEERGVRGEEREARSEANKEEEFIIRFE